MSWNYTFRSTFLVSKYVISFRSIFPFGLYFPSVSMWRFQMNRNYFLGNWLLQCLYDYYHSVCQCTIIYSTILRLARVSIFSQPVKVWKTGRVNFSFTIFKSVKYSFTLIQDDQAQWLWKAVNTLISLVILECVNSK